MSEEQQPCPLVTDYATAASVERKLRPFDAIDPALLEKLFVIRKWPVDPDNPDAPVIPFKRPGLVRNNIWNTATDCETAQPLVIKEFQKQAIHHLIHMPRFILGDAVGLGKAQPLDAKVLTPSGWTTMGEIKIGQEIIDPDGGLARVDGIFPQGRKQIYRVYTTDGASTECCDEHLWTVQSHHDRWRSRKFKTLTTKQLIVEGLKEIKKTTGDTVSKFFLPICSPVVFQSDFKPAIDPYVLGILLGDGCIRTGVLFSSADDEIINDVAGTLPSELHLRPANDYDWQISVGKSGKRNPYIQFLKLLGLHGKYSYEKCIPSQYLTLPVVDRTELLRGLMDSDGECSKDGLAYFSTSSKALADDTAALVRSLGGIASVRQLNLKKYTYKGEKRIGRKSYRVTVKTTFNPFRLERKKNRWKPALQARAIDRIEYVGEKEAQCISVSSKRHLYVTDEYIVTHNTLDALVAFAWLKERNPDAKMVVVTTKSTTYQWMDECLRFTTLRPYVMKDEYKGLKSSEARYSQMIKFFEGKEKDILIVKYDSLKGTRKVLSKSVDDEGNVTAKREDMSEETRTFGAIFKQHRKNLVLVLDECHKFKSEWTQTRNLVWVLCRYPDRVWALTATVIKNGMDEFYAIATAIGVRPLGWMKTFHDEYCRWREQHVGQGRYKKVLIGYENVAQFKKELRPFFFGRSQKQVKEKLPRLTTIYHPIDLDPRQTKILTEDLPNGTIELPPILFKVAGEWREKERDPDNMMTQLSVQQLVTNHWGLLDRNDEKTYLTKALSPKEEALLDMLDGDYRGEKIVVYAQPLDAKISTPSGWRTMGEIRVGDDVSDPDGGEAVVEDIYPQGRKAVYRITTKSGASTECSEDHLWFVQTYSDRRKGKTGRVYPLKKLLEKGVVRTNKNGGRHYRYFLPVPAATEFMANKPLPIPPYTLGALLGDGDIVRAVALASGDAEIIERVRLELPVGLEVRHYAGINYGVATTRPHEKDAKGHNLPGANSYTNALRKLKLQGCHSEEKFIPNAYLRGAIKDRIDLLRGLMDTDGTIGKRNRQPHFSTTSEKLARNVAELVRSLGGLASVCGPYKSTFKHKGVKRPGLPYWQVNIRTNFNPFNLRRKAALWRFVEVTNPIKSIKFAGYKECQCIRVSSKRSLYLTDDYVCTHNTKYRSWIDRLEYLTKEGYFTERKFLRITGNENEKKRGENKALFQDPDSGYDLIVVNAAGIEGINLQQAAHMICLDVPWSWGDLIQLVGRMVRMASPHAACTLHIMVAKGTIDEFAVETLRGKKGVYETILGDSHSAGILDSGESFDIESGMETSGTEEEFRALLEAHVKRVGMKNFLSGREIGKAQSDIQYKMVFERGKKRKKHDVSYEDIKWATE